MPNSLSRPKITAIVLLALMSLLAACEDAVMVVQPDIQSMEEVDKVRDRTGY